MENNCEILVPQQDKRCSLAELSHLARTDRASLYRFILNRLHDPAESEELVQQTFAEATSGIKNFREESRLKTWLYGIALNLVANHLRRAPHLRCQFESEDVLETIPDIAVDPSVYVENQELLGRVQRHLNELPEEMRGTVILVLLDDVSYEKAAQILGIPVGTVRSRVSRGRSILKQHLNR